MLSRGVLIRRISMGNVCTDGEQFEIGEIVRCRN